MGFVSSAALKAAAPADPSLTRCQRWVEIERETPVMGREGRVIEAARAKGAQGVIVVGPERVTEGDGKAKWERNVRKKKKE